MAKLIISAVSQLSNVKTTPPKFAVDTNPNEMPASMDKAPVLLSIASTGTVEADEFAERFAGKCSHLDVVEAIRRINALGETLGECAAQGQNIQLGYLNLEVSVSGTIPDTNAELNEANTAFYSAIPSEKIRKRFAAIDTHIPTTVCPADVKRVRDIETGDNAIHGTDPFFTQGNNLTQGGESEKVELFDEKGETKICDVSVLDATSKISLKTKLDTPVEAGRYYLKVTTLAGGGTTLYPIGCHVTVVNAGTPLGPRITKVVSQKLGEENKALLFKDELTIQGKGYTEATEVFLKLFKKSTGAEIASLSMSGGNHYRYVDPFTMKLVIEDNVSVEPDDSWMANTNEIRLVTREGDRENYVVMTPVR